MNLKSKETELLDIIRKGGRLKTVDIVQKADMCKVTALKYLNRLKKSGLVDYELIGPTKLWCIVDHDRGGLRGRGPLSKAGAEISELVRKFETITGKKTVIIMAGDDFVNALEAAGTKPESKVKRGV